MPQSLSNILIHLVFSTKDRTPNLTPEIRQELFPYLVGVLQNQSCPSLQVGGFEDHVHLLFRLSRTMTIAKVVEHLKTGSSKWVKGKWPAHSSFAWQAGYGAFSISQSETAEVVDYIKNQVEHHRESTFQEEYRELCRVAGIEIEERYAWD
jgi:putative transposase